MANNDIPDSLKSGTGDESELNVLEKAELNVNVTSTVMSFVSYALKTASVHVEHTGRKEITPRDMKRAMMIEVFAYFHRTDLAERVAECRDILLRDGDSGSESGNESESSSETEAEVATPCDCPICAHMEIIEDQWATYVPEDDLGRILKKHIDAM